MGSVISRTLQTAKGKAITLISFPFGLRLAEAELGDRSNFDAGPPAGTG